MGTGGALDIVPLSGAARLGKDNLRLWGKAEVELWVHCWELRDRWSSSAVLGNE